MNFEPTEERRMISDALDRLLAEHCDIGARDAAAFEAPYSNAAAWQALSEMGAFAALADESAGGLGGDGFDIACVFERLGRALCSEPVLPQLMAIRLLAASGAAELEAAISGETRCALAFDEADAWFELERIDTRAEAADGGYRLNGRKSLVYGGPAATVMLVAATLDGTLSAPRRSGSWMCCAIPPSSTSARASSSACRSARSRLCNTALSTSRSRSSRRARSRNSPPHVSLVTTALARSRWPRTSSAAPGSSWPRKRSRCTAG